MSWPDRLREAVGTTPGRIRRMAVRGQFEMGELWVTLATTLLALKIEFLIRRRSLSEAAAACGAPLDTSPNVSPTELLCRGVPAPPFSAAEVRQLKAIRRVLSRWPSTSGEWGRGTCLRESLLTGYYLRSRKPMLRVGAGLVDGVTVFHAWIEVSGVNTGADGFVPLVRMPQQSHA